ncbi:MAG: discoidin domain-containing protein [Bacteroidetes bacterium]|nr:discoidin domain-containing protein [Bacteroidota bacterium]
MKPFFKTILLLGGVLLSSGLHSQPLVNPNATPAAKDLKKFLDMVYGHKIIAGQMDEGYLQYIRDNTGGKEPAMMGYDFNGLSPGQGGNNDAAKAIKWVKEKGGIAQFQWHWNSPDGKGDFYYKNFDLTAALADTGSANYKAIIRDIDRVAVEMKKMQDAGIAILWRPLHEAEGAWFWWGMSGGESCKKLWNLIYDRHTHYHKLNNLIWVWTSYGTTKPNWYPGDSTVDLIVWDYPDYGTNGSWKQYNQLFGGKGKLFGIGEDGTLTNPDILTTQGWLYFLTWAYMVLDTDQHKDGKNSRDWLNQVYNDPRVITLDRMSFGPQAVVTGSKLLFDFDGDGKELVKLKGSSSFTNRGKITHYEWRLNGDLLSETDSIAIELPLGSHSFTLSVTTDSLETHDVTHEVLIRTPSLFLNKTARASSVDILTGSHANLATDGLLSTRWLSADRDPQWLAVDLGTPHRITSVRIYWSAGSAKSYRIDMSNDAVKWTTVRTFTDQPAGERTDSVNQLLGGGRYVRVWGISRNGTGYGIREIEASGQADPDVVPVPEGTQTGIDDHDPGVPNRFRTGHAYPNPFNPETTIPVFLPEAGMVSFQIVNLIGQTVHQSDYFLPAGESFFPVKATTFSTGIYLWQMTFRDQTSGGRFFLLR